MSAGELEGVGRLGVHNPSTGGITIIPGLYTET
ncbi:MAG: hypothetical protein ACI8RZ_001753, partial [Myxococcota bacterium]